jgi:hypothetical protein
MVISPYITEGDSDRNLKRYNMNYKEIKGDLIALALAGEFSVIAHGCNCFSTQKSGIAKYMVEHFEGELWPSRLMGFSIGAIVFSYMADRKSVV